MDSALNFIAIYWVFPRLPFGIIAYAFFWLFVPKKIPGASRRYFYIKNCKVHNGVTNVGNY